jgi:hypothetical protein
MNTHPMKMVTIVCEAYALEPVKRLMLGKRVPRHR